MMHDSTLSAETSGRATPVDSGACRSVPESSVPVNWHFRGSIPRGGALVLFDLDGIISDASNRQELLSSGYPDWRDFFTSAYQDPPIEAGLALAASVVDSCSVVILTARPDYVTEITLGWLDAHKVRHELLILRSSSGKGSHGHSADYKRYELSRLRARGYQIALAIDDDPKNVRMYRSEGVTTLYVHSGYYER